MNEIVDKLRQSQTSYVQLHHKTMYENYIHPPYITVSFAQALTSHLNNMGIKDDASLVIFLSLSYAQPGRSCAEDKAKVFNNIDNGLFLA